MNIISMNGELNLERKKSVMRPMLRAIRRVFRDLIKPKQPAVACARQMKANALIYDRLDPPFVVNLREGIPTDVQPVSHGS
jgi:hypothetical protein